jgi:hypothetical protein
MDEEDELQQLFEAARAQQLDVLHDAMHSSHLRERNTAAGLTSQVLILAAACTFPSLCTPPIAHPCLLSQVLKRKPQACAAVCDPRAAKRLLQHLHHAPGARAAAAALLPVATSTPSAAASVPLKYQLRHGDISVTQRLLDEGEVTLAQVLQETCRSEPDTFLTLLRHNLGRLGDVNLRAAVKVNMGLGMWLACTRRLAAAH